MTDTTMDTEIKKKKRKRSFEEEPLGTPKKKTKLDASENVTPSKTTKEEEQINSDQQQQQQPLSKPQQTSKILSKGSEEISSLVSILTCGSGELFQLGISEDVTEAKRPTPVPDLKNLKILHVTCGGAHNAVIVEKDGRTILYTFGLNDDGVLGRGGEEWKPNPVTALDGHVITSVATGDYAMAALTRDKKLFTWGLYKDNSGSVGFKKNQLEKQTKPVLFEEIKDIKSFDDVTCLVNTTVAVSNGEVFEWGDTICVEEPFRDRTDILIPRRLCFPSDVKIAKVFGGGLLHCFAISVDKDVYGWGLNNYGQVGIGNLSNVIRPTLIDSLGNDVDLISAGQHHSIALKNGNVLSWGRNSYGQLGHGDSKDRSLPEILEFFRKLGDEGHVIQVSCGGNHSVALTKSNKAYAWGFGEVHALGNGRDVDSLDPCLVTGRHLVNKKVYGVYGGGQHTMFVVEGDLN